MGNYSANNKKIAKNTLFLYFRSLIVLFLNLFTSRFVLEALGVEDYGTYHIVGGIVAMFSILASTLTSASQRFITFTLGEKDKEKLKKVFSTCISLHILLALIVSLILEVAGFYALNGFLDIPSSRIEAAHWVLHFSVMTFFINMVSIPYNALITAYERMKAFAYIGILDCVLKFIIALGLYMWAYDKLIAYAFSLTLISLFIRFMYARYCRKNFEESRHITLRIDKNLFKKMFAFAGWNFLGNGSLALRNQGVDILLNVFYGVTVNAAKGLSNQVQHAVMLLVSNFQTAAKPQMTKAVAQGDNERVFYLINQGSRFSFFLLTLMAVPLIVSTQDILELWLKNVPEHTDEFVRWTLIYLLLDSQSRFHIHAILSTGKIRNYELLVGVTKLFAIPFVYMLLKLGCSVLVAVWVNIALEAICFGERLYYNKKQLGFPSLSFIKNIFLPNWITFAASLALPIIVLKHASHNIFVLVPIAIVSSALSIVFVGMNSIERRSFGKMILKKIKLCK